jgi:hypothetical protein
MQPGRSLNPDSYRYSINGQEKTPEIGSNTTTAEFWQYDARIMRRWNIDPKPQIYSSPYSAFDNSPIWRSDPLGDTTKPIFSHVNTASSDGNWAKGALLLPGNTYIKAQNTFASTMNTVVDLGTNDKGLGVSLMDIINGWGEDLKDWWNGTKKYHTETSGSQQLKDAGQWFSNPDNVYGTISDVILIYGTNRLQAGIFKNYSMLDDVPEWKSTSTRGEILAKNKAISLTSEAIVRDRLTSQLASDEILMMKPRFYIQKGGIETYTVPDFAVYNRTTNQFVKIVDAKNGNGGFTTNQNILNREGGTFRGSSRYPAAQPQSVAPGRLVKETTSLHN